MRMGGNARWAAISIAALAAGGAWAQGGAGALVHAVQQCECTCGADTFVLPATDAASCRSLSGADCRETSGSRGALEACSYLFAAPEPAVTAGAPAQLATAIAAPPAAPPAVPPTAPARPAEPPVPSPPMVAAQMAVEEEANRQDAALGSSSPSGAAVREEFLQRFLAALDIPGLSDDNGLLSFRYNPPGGKLGFTAAAQNPALFAPLVAAIPADQQASEVTALEAKLDDFDDVAYQLSFNLQPAGTAMNRKSEIADYSSFLAGETVIYAMESGSTLAGAESHIGLYKFSDLVANQPQLTFGLEGRARAPLAGPNQLEAKLTLEIGLGANFNMLKRACGEPELGCYQRFLAAQGDLVERRWRFELEASFQETDAYDSPLAGVALHLDRAQSLIAKATLGNVLSWDEDAAGKTVEQNTFALEASYEDVSGDATRQDRFVITGTLAQRVTDDMSLELTAVWANKPEYLGEVDEKLGARAGVRYKFNRPPMPAPPGN